MYIEETNTFFQLQPNLDSCSGPISKKDYPSAITLAKLPKHLKRELRSLTQTKQGVTTNNNITKISNKK